MKEWRAVVKGWGECESPYELLKVTGAHKIEVFYARATGRRGAVIVSFSSKELKESARSRLNVNESGVKLQDAYSMRSSSNSWHTVVTWHKGD